MSDETTKTEETVEETPEVPEAEEEQPVEVEEETSEIEPELAELFNVETNGVTDLSDKLSLKPVADLTKAMGINERIFTINELFDGNREEFENIMLALNGLNNFDEAKDVLIRSVAGKYRWHSDTRFKKARNFIKLVQRRYN